MDKGGTRVFPMMPIILPATRRSVSFRLSLWLAVWLMQALSCAVLAGESNPLEPVDTTSPRTTLEGFIKVMNEGYALGYGRVQAYLDSSRLFLSEDDMDALHSACTGWKPRNGRLISAACRPPPCVSRPGG